MCVCDDRTLPPIAHSVQFKHLHIDMFAVENVVEFCLCPGITRVYKLSDHSAITL